MKTIFGAIAASLLLVTNLAHAGYLNGAQLDKKYAAFERARQNNGSLNDNMDYAYFIGYVASITDMLSLEKKICLPPGTTLGQVADVVGRANRSMPASWSMDGSTIVLGALLTSFPCQ